MMDGLSDFLSTVPGNGAAAKCSTPQQSTAVNSADGSSKTASADDVVSTPPPRLLDSDPSKFRSLKRVIVIGRPGRGVDGIGDALKKLGFKVYDFQAASDRYERDFPLWLEAARLRQEQRPYSKSDYDKVIGDHDAIVGAPACFFDEEFVRLYSNVKVILLTRDSDQSTARQLCEKVTSPFWQRIDSAYFGSLGRLYTLNPDTGGGDRENSNQVIRNIVRDKNLLEIHNLVAWVPLCEFLGVRVPDGPAPELHDNTLKAILAARPHRMISKKMKTTSLRAFEGLKYLLTIASVYVVSALAVFLGVIGLCRFSSSSVQLLGFLLSRSQIRDVTRLLAVGGASCTFVCGIIAGYCVALMHKPAVAIDSPRPDSLHKGGHNRRRVNYGRGRHFDNIEKVRPERPVLQEWSGVQENVRKDDAEMRKEGEASLEEWRNGKHVTFHVRHKRTVAGRDLFSGPRKIVSITEETVR